MSTNSPEQIIFKSLDPFSEFDLVKEIWIKLLNVSSHSYFLSWGWTEIWLKSLPRDCGLHLIVGYVKGAPVLAFFIGSKDIVRHKFFKISQLSLNLTLIPTYDLIYIEYNSILMHPGCKISFESILENMPLESWDELLVTRHSSIYKSDLLINSSPGNQYEKTHIDTLSYYVDLEKMSSDNNDYLWSLSKNKRKQIRRTIKEYEEMGEIRIHFADNIEDALIVFDELRLLHQNEWTKRGYPGVFSNDYFVQFHKALIKTRFQHEEIQLLKVTAGDFTVGCLYNFLYGGRVLCYQSGYTYIEGNVYRPGLICDYYAIIHNIKLGMSIYDFLSGDHEYKKSLSTDYNVMRNTTIHKKSLKYSLEKYCLPLYNIYKGVMEKIYKA